MKKMLLAAMVAMAAAPAFANENMSTDEQDMAAEQLMMDESFIPAEELDAFSSDEQDLMARWRCVARNRYGRRFIAMRPALNQARRQAVRQCQLATPFPYPFNRCVLVGCQRFGRW